MVVPLSLTFDNGANSSCTTVVLTGADRDGLLASVVSAFATLDVHVVSAHIETDASGCVNNTFLVQTHEGAKLKDADLPSVRAVAYSCARGCGVGPKYTILGHCLYHCVHTCATTAPRH